MMVSPTPLMMRATTMEEKPSPVNSTDRWEKPGLASPPMHRLTMAMSAHIFGVRLREGAGDASSAGTDGPVFSVSSGSCP